MRVLDLFSGIGAFSLGLERAGMKTISFCEIDPFCQRVLAKHWPEVRCYSDVRELSAQHLTADGHGDIDVICGGFPCQDISIAGDGIGITGERSGLWSEFARLISEIRPRYAIVENTSALLHRGLGDVLGDLAALGYDAEWHCIPASYVGACHVRDRTWVVAYATSIGWPEAFWAKSCAQAFAARAPAGMGAAQVWNWPLETVVCRKGDAAPRRVDRVRAVGNSLVPQIPELIGRAIMAAESCCGTGYFVGRDDGTP